MNSTSAPPQDLGAKTARSIAWVFSTSAVTTVARMALFGLLARLLHASDFGLFAAVNSVIALVEVLFFQGISPALIQRRELTPRHVSSACFLSLGLGVLAVVGTWLMAGEIGKWMQMPELGAALRIASPILLIRSVSHIGYGLASRELNFALTSRVDLISFAAYAASAVVFAANGFGPWTLICAFGVQYAVGLTILTLPYSRQFSFVPHFQEIKELLGFASGISVANLGSHFAQNGDYYVIGRALGVESLGLYNRAYSLMQISVTAIINGLDTVLFPALSRIQGDRPALARCLRLNIAVVWLVYLPTSLLFIVVSPEMITVLLGAKWLPMVGAFRILSCGLMFRAGYKMAGTILKVQGIASVFAMIQGAYALLVILGALGGVAYGIEGASVGVLCALGLNFFLNNFLAFRSLEEKFTVLNRDLGAAVILSGGTLVVSMTAVQAARALMLPPVLTLLCVGLSAVGLYIAVFGVVLRKLLSPEVVEFYSRAQGVVVGRGSKIRRKLIKLRPGKLLPTNA